MTFLLIALAWALAAGYFANLARRRGVELVNERGISDSLRVLLEIEERMHAKTHAVLVLERSAGSREVQP